MEGVKKVQARVHPEYGSFNTEASTMARETLIIHAIIRPVDAELLYEINPVVKDILREKQDATLNEVAQNNT